jgi:hypothetical protein
MSDGQCEKNKREAYAGRTNGMPRKDEIFPDVAPVNTPPSSLTTDLYGSVRGTIKQPEHTRIHWDRLRRRSPETKKRGETQYETMHG